MIDPETGRFVAVAVLMRMIAVVEGKQKLGGER